MKKLVFILSSVFLGMLIFIVVFSKNKKEVLMEEYYTIPQTMTYIQKEEMMNFIIYANQEHSLIEFPELNSYFLCVDKNQYQLSTVEVEKEKDPLEDSYYKYIIKTPLLSFSTEDLFFKDAILKIQNESFTLRCRLGNIGIYNKEYEVLDFTDLYGNYAYIKSELHFIGFTIALNREYQNLEEVRIYTAFSPLSYVEKDVLYDSQRKEKDILYPLVQNESYSGFRLNAKEGYYYIPIAHEALYLITRACILFKIDGKIYYIPDFTFLANNISISDYPDSKLKGEISYAKA